MRRAVRLDVGTVDGGALRHRAGHRKRLDQIGPEPFARPAVEAVVDRGRRPILFRAVAPPATHLENMDDAGDHPAIIDPAGAALVPRQKRLDDRPLLIRQPKQAHHPSLQITDLAP